MRFALVWYGKDDRQLGIIPFLTNEDEVRQAFNLEKDEYPGDCLQVTPAVLEWIQAKTGVEIPCSDLSEFDFFVECFR